MPGGLDSYLGSSKVGLKENQGAQQRESAAILWEKKRKLLCKCLAPLPNQPLREVESLTFLGKGERNHEYFPSAELTPPAWAPNFQKHNILRTTGLLSEIKWFARILLTVTLNTMLSTCQALHRTQRTLLLLIFATRRCVCLFLFCGYKEAKKFI